jgi:hypothetical protein
MYGTSHMHRKAAVRSGLIVVYSSITLNDHVIPTFGTDWQLFFMDSEWCSVYSTLNISTKKIAEDVEGIVYGQN